MINKIFQNGIYREYLKVKQFNNLSLDEKQQILEKELKSTLQYVKEHSAYYAELLSNIEVQNFTIEELKLIPLTNKTTIINSKRSNYTRSLKRSDILTHTGGTTGAPFTYGFSKKQYERSMGASIWGWEMAGFTVGDRVGFLDNVCLGGGLQLIKNKFKNIYPRSMYDINQNNVLKYLNYYDENKVHWIRIVPSAMYELVKICQDLGVDSYKIRSLKGIFSTGEMLYDFQRKLIEEFFNVKVFNQYGAGDGAILAVETLDSNGLLEINMYKNILELKENKVIGTQLDKHPLFPFIRYEVGDEAVYSEPAIIGEKMYLEKVMGRTFQNIILNDGTRIHGLFFVHIMDDFTGVIMKFEVVQVDINTLYIYLQLKNKDNFNLLCNQIEEKIRNKIGDKLAIKFEIRDNLEDNNKKFLYVKRKF